VFSGKIPPINYSDLEQYSPTKFKIQITIKIKFNRAPFGRSHAMCVIVMTSTNRRVVQLDRSVELCW